MRRSVSESLSSQLAAPPTSNQQTECRKTAEGTTLTMHTLVRVMPSVRKLASAQLGSLTKLNTIVPAI